MPLAFPKLLPTALGFCPSPAEREPWDCQGKTLGILYWETASPNLRIWNSIWNIRDLLQDEKMRYSSFPFGSVCTGKSLWVLLAFPSPSPSWLLLNGSAIVNLLPQDTVEYDLSQVLQCTWAMWEQKDKCYLCLKLLCAEMPAPHRRGSPEEMLCSDLSVLDSLSARQRSRSWWRACNSAWSLCSRSRLPL